MFNIKYVTGQDETFWYSLDRYLPRSEFALKVRDKRGYIIFDDEIPIGIVRYNLFWDIIPFLTLIYLKNPYRGKGFGMQAMLFWENEMRDLGFSMLMTSTQVDEEAQRFYRKLGFIDKGNIVMDIPPYEQPLEMFLIKPLFEGM